MKAKTRNKEYEKKRFTNFKSHIWKLKRACVDYQNIGGVNFKSHIWKLKLYDDISSAIQRLTLNPTFES